ncbi:hypothetical protein BXT84_12825 [Sulfobacillus thermotolerans]|uniref:Uncharacterized protein n=1 Tax=Sulfobacillus thermotolerans TaxID=338644 RepID=A0ABN5H492_9FIRM|nr:hypothetical protein BXT84_12825 [Sulfobacillus thermotolerans]
MQQVGQAEKDAEKLEYLQSQIQNLNSELVESERALKILEDEVAAVQALESTYREELEKLMRARERRSDLDQKITERQRLAAEESQLIHDITQLENRQLELQKNDIAAEQALITAQANYEEAAA